MTSECLPKVAGPNCYVVKLLPPVTMTDQDIEDTAEALEKVVAMAHQFPGAIWDLGKTLAKHSLTK